MEKNKRHEFAIDALRVFSILAVVAIHTTTRTLELSGYALLQIPLTLFINQIARFAVPLFIIISGFVLELNFHLNENYFVYFKKRINKIFIPYVFWSAVYYFLVYYKGRNPNFFGALIDGDASYQLYFIPTLLVFYLIFPLLHKYFKYIGKYVVIAILFLAEILLLYYDYNIKSISIFYPLKIVLLNYFPFILGIFLARKIDIYKTYISKIKSVLGLGTLIMMFLVFKEGLNGYLSTHNYLTFYSQWRPSVLIYTIFICSFSYWLFNREVFNSVFIKLLSRLSFFVFFIHVIIIEILYHLIPQIAMWNLTFFISVILISFSIAFLIHKIPYVSKITG